jgi:predicted esterase
MLPNALPENYLIAQLVAPKWSKPKELVWPTEKQRDPTMKFTTEAFIDAVVAEVKAQKKIDAAHIYALGWSSGGPPVYAAAMREKTPLTGAFVAMSVFKPAQLPKSKLDGRRFYILHSPQDMIPMTFAQSAKETLAKSGAKTELATYEGGHGWKGDVFGMIRDGMDWLEAK